MKAKVLILLALAVLTAASSGCCRTCRNWLRRGSLCGTTTVAPATMGAPVALGTPYVQQPYVQPQYLQPQMAAPVQQVVVPQANCQCVPQCVPVCQPCYDPCATMCSPCGPCTWSDGYMESDCCGQSAPASGYEGGTMVPSTGQPTIPQTFVPQGSSITPGPASETTNYPESTKTSETN